MSICQMQNCYTNNLHSVFMAVKKPEFDTKRYELHYKLAMLDTGTRFLKKVQWNIVLTYVQIVDEFPQKCRNPKATVSSVELG